MKAVKVMSFGGPEVLVLADDERPTATAQQVVIAVASVGVGAVDVLLRKGLFLRSEPGYIPGVEVAGTVVEVGEQVDAAWIGKRVFATTLSGGYAEFIAVQVGALVPIPDTITTTQAVALGVNALVGAFSLERTACANGDRILLRGAGGGIGSITAQLALHLTTAVTAVSTSPEKEAQLQVLGVKQFVRKEEINNYTGEFDIILDPVAGEDVDRYVNLLADNGKYLISGVAGGFPLPDFGSGWMKRIFKSLSLLFLSLNSIPQERKNTKLAEIFDRAVDGRIIPVIDKVYSLDNAAAAHRYLESGKVFGKIVLEIHGSVKATA